MRINPSYTVGKITVSLSGAAAVFEKNGLDYCLHGGETLRAACFRVRIPLEEITNELEKVEERPMSWYMRKRNWDREPMADLIDYIVHIHHDYSRCEARLIDRMLEEAVEELGDKNPILATIQEYFLKMAEEQIDHMRLEEEKAFPYLIQAERALQRNDPVPHPFRDYDLFQHPLKVLEWDYGLLGREWNDINRLTHHFQVSPEQKEYLGHLYDAMKRLEFDTRHHVHLEGILLKKAVGLGLLDEVKLNEIQKGGSE